MKTAVIILLLLPMAASAGLYKWTDKDGRVHYTQTPPPAGSTGSEVAPAAPPAGAAGAGSSNGAIKRYRNELEHSTEQREHARQQAEKTAQRRQEVCTHARARAQTQTQYQGRIFSMDENGKRVYQSADENAQARAALEQQVSENCD